MFSKSIDHSPLFDNLHIAYQVNDIKSNLWNDKCDYLEDVKNLNSYEQNLLMLQLNIHSGVSKKTELIDILNTCMRKKVALM